MRQLTTARRRAALAALALALALAACGAHQFRGMVLEPPNPAPDFTLADAEGQPFQLSAQRGKVTVMFFGFTHCPDVCPTELADLKAVRARLGADAERLQVVFITVDPERDTPAAVAKYVRLFDKSFVGLSGPRAALEPIYKAYGVTAERRELPGSALGYTMDHSAFTYVIDKDGNYRMLFSHGSSIDDMVSDLGYLLRA